MRWRFSPTRHCCRDRHANPHSRRDSSYSHADSPITTQRHATDPDPVRADNACFNPTSFNCAYAYSCPGYHSDAFPHRYARSHRDRRKPP